MGITPGLIAAIAASVSAAGGLAGTAYSMSQGGGGSQPKMPTAPTMDPSSMQKTMIPGAKADTAARAGGGFSPSFLEGLIGQQSGSPVGMDVLGDIRKQIGGGA